MASDRHDDLDELDEDPPPEIVVDEPRSRLPFTIPLPRIPLPRIPLPRVSLRRVVMGLAVLALGGGLGGAIFLVTAYDPRELIGMLDIGESPPRLAMALPGLGDGTQGAAMAPGTAGGLLTPPTSTGPQGSPLKAVPDDPASSPPAAQGPANPEAPPPAADPAQDELARIEAAAQRPATTKPAAGPGSSSLSSSDPVPIQPSPRSAEKQPPSFDALALPKGEAKALPPAPIKDLLRKTQVGELPYPAADGRQPWQVYSRPWAGPQDRGKVAVVVVELGLDRAATDAAIAKLPPEVSLAFSPYAGGLDKWVKKARDHGHEVLMDLPAQSGAFPARDPGPYGLLVSASAETNLTRLETVMSKAQGYAGLVSLGGAYTSSPAMAATLAALKDHGLMYVGGGSGPPDRSPPAARVTAVVDAEPFREAIDMRLNQVSVQARTEGQALAVIYARPLSLTRLGTWLNDLDGQNLVLVPASTLVRPPPATANGKS